MGRRRPNEVNRHVTKYLAPNETVMLELRQHWARVLPAIACCFTGLLLVLLTGFAAPADLGFMTNAACWLWLVLVLHLAWRTLEWWDQTFVVTNRRIILVHGIFVKKVAMMPLSKVTDMSYNRSVMARLLGFGTFVMESAGQEQALSTIDYVRHPDGVYRSLCGLIFGDDEPDGPTHDRHGRPSREEHGWDAEDEEYDFSDDADPWHDSWPDWHRDWDDAPQGVRHEGILHEPQRGEHDARHDSSHDGTTRPMPIRRKMRRDVDDTDPYGMVTDAAPVSRNTSTRPYSERITREESEQEDDDSAWSVSHEHATRPQPVHRSRYVDPPVTPWDDA